MTKRICLTILLNNTSGSLSELVTLPELKQQEFKREFAPRFVTHFRLRTAVWRGRKLWSCIVVQSPMLWIWKIFETFLFLLAPHAPLVWCFQNSFIPYLSINFFSSSYGSKWENRVSFYFSFSFYHLFAFYRSAIVCCFIIQLSTIHSNGFVELLMAEFPICIFISEEMHCVLNLFGAWCLRYERILRDFPCGVRYFMFPVETDVDEKPLRAV